MPEGLARGSLSLAGGSGRTPSGLDALLAQVATYDPKAPRERIIAAYELAARAHAGQFRDNGDRKSVV